MGIQSLNTKENAKLIRRISFALSMVAIIAIALSSILPVIFVQIPGSTDPEFTYDVGQAFLGWQVTFYYFGPNIPIADRQAFLTNPLMIVAMVGSCIVLLVLALLGRKGKRMKKGVLQVLEALVLLFVAIVYLNACAVVLPTAGNLTKDAIVSANEQGGYMLGWYSILLGILAIVLAVAKMAFGAFFLLFRKPAPQHDNERIQIEQ